ncbi:hypothetical protein SUGI_0973590 [Cryptomeria japonica]|nr:hypothetical protein SUGI_0973590 [Cryptomeria japonica]
MLKIECDSEFFCLLLQVFNHGIDLGLLELIKKVAREFINLLFQEKDKYAMVFLAGYGHAFITSDDQKLDLCNMMALGIMPKSTRKKNLWHAKPLLFSFPVIQWRYLHSDGSALTVLLQYDDCVGLQIFKQNKWISVEPIPDALVINIGDTLEVLTNGEYESVEHRAVTNGNKEIDEDHPPIRIYFMLQATMLSWVHYSN